MIYNLYRLRPAVAVGAGKGTCKRGPNLAAEGLAGPSLSELPESCFPSGCVTVETREGERKGEGMQKWPDQEQAEPFLAVVPLLKGEPAVNRGECEAHVRRL